MDKIRIQMECPGCQVKYSMEAPKDYAYRLSLKKWPVPLDALETGLYSRVCSKECSNKFTQKLGPLFQMWTIGRK